MRSLKFVQELAVMRQACLQVTCLRMYMRYCERRGWKTAILSESEGTVGGYKEVQLEVIGEDVYGTLKFESGVHRVQRVPDTEGSGRVHTSAATVAVMPEAEEVDFELNLQM